MKRQPIGDQLLFPTSSAPHLTNPVSQWTPPPHLDTSTSELFILQEYCMILYIYTPIVAHPAHSLYLLVTT